MDIFVDFQGSIVLFIPHSDVGQDWLDDNVDQSLTLGRATCCEWRYAPDIINGAIHDGIKVHA